MESALALNNLYIMIKRLAVPNTYGTIESIGDDTVSRGKKNYY